MGKKRKRQQMQQQQNNQPQDTQQEVWEIMKNTKAGDTMEFDYDKAIIFSGKLMVPFSADGYVGWRPIPILESSPSLWWNGGRIRLNEPSEHHPNGLWPEVVAFFHFANETHDEGQVRLFYNPETEEWRAWAFPQIGSGMTTKEDSDDPDRDKQRQEIGEGFRQWGTIHSHCNMSAFQSSTDENDESSQNGIHITVGNLDNNEMSIHGRLYMHKIKYDLIWSEWFSADVDVSPLEAVPDNLLKLLLKTLDVKTAIAKLRGDFLEQTLKRNPGKETAFPALWKENFNKRKPGIVTPPYSSSTYYGRGHGGHKFSPSHVPLNEHWPDETNDGWERLEGGGWVKKQRPTQIEGFKPREGVSKSETKIPRQDKVDDDMKEEITLYERDFLIDVLGTAEITGIHENYVRSLAREMANRDWTHNPTQAYNPQGEAFIARMVKEATERGINTFRGCFLIVAALQEPCSLVVVEPAKDGGAVTSPFDLQDVWKEFNKTQESNWPYNVGD